MSGNPRPPTERITTDLCPEAFPAAPTFAPRKLRDTGHPTHGQQPQRQASTEPPLLTSHLELGPLLTAAGSARGHVRAVLTEWGLDELSDVTELLVSELITNAVVVTQALDAPLPFPVRLWVYATRKRVRVTVWDADPQPPVLREDVDVQAENGRGLWIVDALSSRWGWYAPPVVGGKCVWCEIPRKPAY
jgi:anti-sigma regulatory factor (Ser/Thr protein kinase)